MYWKVRKPYTVGLAEEDYFRLQNLKGFITYETVNCVVDHVYSSFSLQGIQGHHNSCYLDATLFSMFAFTQTYDALLFREKKEDDIAEYEDVQRVLKDGIVNPLRK